MIPPPTLRRRLLLSFLLLLLSAVTTTVSNVDVDEFSSMLAVLRARDRHALFANAIATSAVALDLLTSTAANGSSSSFTIFAPDDSDLYALDTVESASEYTSALRCHVIPQRLTGEDLRRLSNGSSLPSLAGHGAIMISTSFDGVIEVNGVRVVSLGLFYGRNVAVHGLRGILRCTDGENTANAHPPMAIPVNVTEPLQSSVTSPETGSFTPSPAKSPETGSFAPSLASSFTPSPAKSPETGSFTETGDSAPSLAKPPDIGDSVPSPVELGLDNDLFSAIGIFVDEEEREKEAIRAMSPADLRAVIEDELDGDCYAVDGFDLVVLRSYCDAST